MSLRYPSQQLLPETAKCLAAPAVFDLRERGYIAHLVHTVFCVVFPHRVGDITVHAAHVDDDVTTSGCDMGGSASPPFACEDLETESQYGPLSTESRD
jgi:hypothetical protein